MAPWGILGRFHSNEEKRRARPRRKGLAQIRRRMEGVAFPLPVKIFNIFGREMANKFYLKHLLIGLFSFET